MADQRYFKVDPEDAKKHDELYNKAEAHLLNMLGKTTSPQYAKQLAESYALLRGSYNGGPNIEVKNG